MCFSSSQDDKDEKILWHSHANAHGEISHREGCCIEDHGFSYSKGRQQGVHKETCGSHEVTYEQLLLLPKVSTTAQFVLQEREARL